MLLAQDTRFNAFKTNKLQISSRNMFSEILTCPSNVKHKTWKGTIYNTDLCCLRASCIQKSETLISGKPQLPSWEFTISQTGPLNGFISGLARDNCASALVITEQQHPTHVCQLLLQPKE